MLTPCKILKFILFFQINSQAPERFGSLLATLVKVGALSREDLDTIVQEARQNCLVENMNTEEDCERIFGRLMAQLSAEYSR